MTTSAPDDEARARLIAAIRAAKNRPRLPFRQLSSIEAREIHHHIFLGAIMTTVLAGSSVVFAVAAIHYRAQPEAFIVVGLVALLGVVCTVVTLFSTLRAVRLVRHQNPVLVESLHRGDYADFAEQLRRGRGRWRKRDVRRALPLIDQWAHDSGQI